MVSAPTCPDRAPPREEPFRVPAVHVTTVEVNGTIANLFFREYHGTDWVGFEAYPAAAGSAVYEELVRQRRQPGGNWRA